MSNQDLGLAEENKIEAGQSPAEQTPGPQQAVPAETNPRKAIRFERLRKILARAILLVSLVVLGLGIQRLVLEVRASSQVQAAKKALEEERYEDAKTDLEKALRIRPSSPEIHLLAARTYRLLYDYPLALSHLEATRDKAKGETEEQQLEWLMFRAETGEIDQVYPLLVPYITGERAEAPQVLQALARGFIWISRIGEAKESVGRWIHLQPKSAVAHFMMARISSAENFREGSIDELRKVIELRPDWDQARTELGTALLLINRWKEALGHFEALYQKLPDDPQVLVGLAKCRVAMGKKEKAQELLARAIQLDANNAAAYLEKGRLALQQKNLEDAEKNLKAAVDLEPSNYVALYNLVQCLSIADKPDEEKKYRKQLNQLEEDERRITSIRTMKLVQNPRDPNLYIEIAELLMRWKAYRTAGVHLMEADRISPGIPKVYALLAEYYEHVGKKERSELFKDYARKAEEYRGGMVPNAAPQSTVPGDR